MIYIYIYVLTFVYMLKCDQKRHIMMKFFGYTHLANGYRSKKHSSNGPFFWRHPSLDPWEEIGAPLGCLWSNFRPWRPAWHHIAADSQLIFNFQTPKNRPCLSWIRMASSLGVVLSVALCVAAAELQGAKVSQERNATGLEGQAKLRATYHKAEDAWDGLENGRVPWGIQL